MKIQKYKFQIRRLGRLKREKSSRREDEAERAENLGWRQGGLA
jgi:hypothetical protein